MRRFHGLVLMVNTLLPAIIVLAVIFIHVNFVRPVIEDLTQVQGSLAEVQGIITTAQKKYKKAGAEVRDHIAVLKNDFAPIISLYGGVRKLSENFCGNLGKVKLSASHAYAMQVAQLNALQFVPTSATYSVLGPDIGVRGTAVLKEQAGEAIEKVEELWNQARGGGKKAAEFASGQTCKATQTAFQTTFAVLGTVMSPFDDMQQALEEIEKFSAPLNKIRMDATRGLTGILKIIDVLRYVTIVLFVWFAIVYVLRVSTRLQRGWKMFTAKD